MGFWNFISKLFAKKEITFQNSSDASLHALLTQAADEYRTEHRKKAETLFLQALEEATPSSAEPLVEYNLQFLQFLWLQNEAHPKAIKCLSDFIAKFKDSASAYRCRASLVGRGQVLVELGKLGEAQEDLGRALQLLNKVPNVRDKIWASSQAYTRNAMGGAWAAMGDFSKAMEEFELSIALRPENAWVYFNRAEAFKKMNRFSEAFRDYQKALTSNDPGLPVYKIALAQREIQPLERSPG